MVKLHTPDQALVPPTLLAFTSQKYGVLFARPLIDAVGVVRPGWLDSVDAKVDDVDTRTVYDAAPVTAPQPMVSEVGWLVAPLVGDASVGGTGAEMIVVKLHMLDQALVPPTLLAFTSQKYGVLFARPLIDAVGIVRPGWLDTVDAKLDDVDTRTVYDAAPVTAPQFIVSEVARFTEEFVGEFSVGALGAPGFCVSPLIQAVPGNE